MADADAKDTCDLGGELRRGLIELCATLEVVPPAYLIYSNHDLATACGIRSMDDVERFVTQKNKNWRKKDWPTSRLAEATPN